MLSKEDTSYFKHVLMGKIKKFFKNLFAKGPEDLSIKIMDDIVIMQSTGILRKVELELIAKQPNKADTVLAYRTLLFEFRKDSFIRDIEEILDRQIVSLVFDINVSDDTAVCLIILNRPV